MKFIKMGTKKGRILKIERFKILFAKFIKYWINIHLIKIMKNTFNDIKEECWKTEDKSNKFIEQMIDYFNIKDKKKLAI